MIERYLNDYYKVKLSPKEICKKIDVNQTTFHRKVKKMGLLTRTQWYKKINTGIPELNQILKVKYGSMANRCNGKTTDYYGYYKGKPYMSICEWADFCNKNKNILIALWQQYINQDRDNKYAISIDRLDNNGGYVKNNMHFVTHGFNSWKRNINPIRVTEGGKDNYFMSCEEASRYYGLRKQTIGECLSNKKYHMKGYFVERETIEIVLKNKRCNDLKDYYRKAV